MTLDYLPFGPFGVLKKDEQGLSPRKLPESLVSIEASGLRIEGSSIRLTRHLHELLA